MIVDKYIRGSKGSHVSDFSDKSNSSDNSNSSDKIIQFNHINNKLRTRNTGILRNKPTVISFSNTRQFSCTNPVKVDESEISSCIEAADGMDANVRKATQKLNDNLNLKMRNLNRNTNSELFDAMREREDHIADCKERIQNEKNNGNLFFRWFRSIERYNISSLKANNSLLKYEHFKKNNNTSEIEDNNYTNLVDKNFSFKVFLMHITDTWYESILYMKKPLKPLIPPKPSNIDDYADVSTEMPEYTAGDD